MNKSLEFIESRINDFQYADFENNRVVVTAGLQATFYFWGGYQSEVRERIADCAESYENSYGGHLKWQMHPEQTRRIWLDQKKLPPLRQYASTLGPDDAIQWYVSSGDDDAAAEYRLQIYTGRKWKQGDMSLLSFTLPRRFAFEAEERERFFSLFHLCIEKLNPFHAHAGLAVVTPYAQEDFQAEELDISTRLRAIYIEPTFVDISYAHHGIKSIDWMTFISTTLAQKVENVHSLLRPINTDGVHMGEHLSQGVLFLTGETPELLPIESGIPSNFSTLNAMLRPMRTCDFGSMGFDQSMANRALRVALPIFGSVGSISPASGHPPLLWDWEKRLWVFLLKRA